jgi:mono/diheme cytochrome c family protein
MRTSTSIVLIPIFAGAFAACSSARGTDGSAPDVDAEPAPPPSVAGPQPDFGPLVQAKEPPPPISGGTLAVAKDGFTAVAADADRDRVYVVDVPARAVRRSIRLPRRSEPGRVVIDDRGRAHVVLRKAGGVATIDLATGDVSTLAVCTSPRGIAFDGANGALHVACATGELVSIPLDGGAPRRTPIALDLRDVAVKSSGTLVVSRFRSAEVVRIDKAGQAFRAKRVTQTASNLAWRTLVAKAPDGCTGGDCDAEVVVEQTPSPEPVKTDPGGYGGGGPGEAGECAAQGIVTTRIELVGRGAVRLPLAVLPVDIATNGREYAVIAAGNAFTRQLPQIFVVSAQTLSSLGPIAKGGVDPCPPDTVHGNVPGQAIAAAFDGQDELLVQTREPAAIHVMTEDRRRSWKTITLATDSVSDTGHAIFHSNAGGFIACASCHAEGADDGHTWQFVDMGPRRTPSLQGTLPGTEPFHWDGDMKDLRALVDHVFVERMSGPKVDDAHLDVLKRWLFSLPPPAKLHEPTAATARGRTLFEARCTSCHAGERLTNNQTVDVGTGGRFQVPSLVGVGWRAPFLHSGCAETLFDRFTPACGGSAHGSTGDLSESQIADLVDYLETL